MKTNPALSALRHHVSGAIARGEAQAITEVPAPTRPAHTPGPWTILPNTPHFVRAMHPAEGMQPVATVYHFDGELAANARLIAAAPELIEALEATEAKLTQAARAFYGAGSAKALREAFAGWRTTSESARAAIAKARG